VATSDVTPRKERYLFVDCLRGFAVLLMVVFHAVFDAGLFGIVDVPFLDSPYWLGFAKFIVSLFLLCVGIGLALVHRRAKQWNLVWKRFYILGAWALAITAVTYILLPEHAIVFGALHCIAATSVAGVLFVGRPRLALVLAGLIMISNLIFDPEPLPLSDWLHVAPMDDVPFYPWFSVVLLGIYLESINVHRLPVKENGFTRSLAVVGRHSLKIYLIHQPILVGICILIYKIRTGFQ
jgi:uncharacterized membrane protein